MERGGRRKIQSFVDRLRAFHGFDIRLSEDRSIDRRSQWTVEVPTIGARHRGTYIEVINWLYGYQQGWLAGRKYTNEESTALLKDFRAMAKGLIIEEVLKQHKGV